MISPESYYEEYLKGKTKEEIMTAIRGLKQEKRVRAVNTIWKGCLIRFRVKFSKSIEAEEELGIWVNLGTLKPW